MQDEAGAPLTAAHDRTTTPSTAERRRSRLFGVLAAAALTVLTADQLSKLWALRNLTPGEPVDLVGTLIRLNLIRNPGAAFSLGDSVTWVLTLIAVGVLVFILFTARRLGSLAWAWALGLLLGGSVGNLADRMFRTPGPGRGHVVDFIDYFGWFIGNVADIAIVGAALLIGVLAMRGIGVDGVREKHGGRHERGARPHDAARPEGGRRPAKDRNHPDD